jgi:predicted metal-dependent hydrolase
MNHGPAFWALLDQCTDGEAKKLRKEMKQYHIP